MKIAISGAGLLGRLLAWRLLRAGHQVVLDDPVPSGEASAAYVAAAMLAPWSEITSSDEDSFRWGCEGLSLWPEWLTLLEQDSGMAVDYWPGGSLLVAHELDRADFQHFLQHLHSKQPGSGQLLTRQAIAELEPQLAGRFDRALYLPDEACMDNRQLLQALGQAIEKLGGRIQTEVWDEAEWTIDCRGVGAADAWSDLRGVRGEVIRVHAPEVSLQRAVRLMHPRYQLYVVPRAGQRYVVGATEIESSHEGDITVRSALELLSALYALDSGFAEASIESCESRCRPALADNRPQIQADLKAAKPQLRANGLYRHGFLLAPAVVARLEAVVAGDAAVLGSAMLQLKAQAA